MGESSFATAWVGLGANLADPASHLRRALREIAALADTDVTGTSRLYRSPPLDGSEQPDYCNAVAVLRTGLSPGALLRHLHGMEAAHGRRRDRHWAARSLDCDLLLHGAADRSDGGLVLPHPGLTRRAFVLHPLAELLPDGLLPDGRRVADAAAELPRPERWL